ncbi:MAG TPA: HEAT repeat domain-containing protein [Chryseolinea sp.]|nr:HEAT repeat domain-containing protein [Chryseolinea sp.]
MEKEKLETLLIDYIDGKLNNTERHDVEQLLVADTEAFKTYEQLKVVIHAMQASAKMEPTARLKRGFEQMLLEEEIALKKGRVVLFQPSFYRVAAAIAFVVLGGAIAYIIARQNQQSKQIKETLMTMLDNQNSASQRVLGATVAYNDIERADDEIVNALVNAMNEDPNTNVRLAALEALGKFRSQPHVRKALVASLTTQKDPVVQIALIRLMVEMKEKDITNELEKISTDEESIQAVKDEAQAGILRLS